MRQGYARSGRVERSDSKLKVVMDNCRRQRWIQERTERIMELWEIRKICRCGVEDWKRLYNVSELVEGCKGCR